MKPKDRIGLVLYIFYLLLLVASVLIVLKIIYLQVGFKPDPKIADAIAPSSSVMMLEPSRGNIIDSEGRLLAMSYPMFTIHMDCTVLKKEIEETKNMKLAKAKSEDQKDSILAEAAAKEQAWLKKASELSKRLPEYFPEKTAGEYEKLIREGRKNNKKYVKIGHQVDWDTYCKICELPLFREGQFKSGMIVEKTLIRMYPYGTLARRTIGFVRDNRTGVENTHIGLEGKYDAVLHGKDGKEYLRKTDHGRMRDNDSAYVKPVDGKDIRTTINIDYQDIADSALREQIEEENDIQGGCVVLMETSTGAIRAMVNLVRNEKTGKFEEIQNIAIGRKCEPGSVFKTVTLMSVLNDGKIKSLEETLPATDGHVKGTDIDDPHIPEFRVKHNTDKISIIDGFKISSNYVFATLAVKYYGKDPMRFNENIFTYKLGEEYDFDLEGMEKPFIANKENRAHWTDSDLGRVGYGYCTEETPMHILTFYNAIANKGRMMKPYLVEDIESSGIVTEKRGPSVLNASVCSKAIADTLTRALRAVTEDGTARRNLSGVKCSVAGKTGTSYGTFPNGEYSDGEGRKKYQGTFVGFFPADGDKDPKYSIVCFIFSNPTSKQYQGGGIPARVTRTVVNSLYNIDPYFRAELGKEK